MPLRPTFLLSTALSSLGFAWIVSPALSADLKPVKAPLAASPDPAVSGPNFKIAGFGGWLDGKADFGSYGSGLGGGLGSLTIPLGAQFGLQVDGIAGSWGGDTFYGTGGHLFWRDPQRGMLGAYGSWLRLDRGDWPFLSRGAGVDVTTFMGEGEVYWNSFTLRTVAGWEGGDITSRFTARTDLAWYATPDLELSVGHRYVGGNNALALKGEWLTPTTLGSTGARASLFAEARIGEDDYRGIWGGIRLYFGKSQTLIDKHRRDDPTPDPNIDNLHGAQTLVKQLNLLNEQVKTSTSTSTAVPSDARLKRDIELLGRLESGIGIYRYRYLWSETVYVGVMAQEVAEIMPHAVRRASDGYLRVDYEKLGLRLLTWDQWVSQRSDDLLPRAA